MRTYTKGTIQAAESSWSGYGWEWQKLRRQAAERGMLYAPSGTEWDSIEDDQPSQRAIIWQAMADNPKSLEVIMRRANTWSGVIAGILQHRAWLREQADDLDRDTAWGRQDEPDGRQATMSLKSILSRIGDS